MRNWWASPKQPNPVLFEVSCACGTVAQGERQARHQVRICAKCGGKVFVLPLSPFRDAAPSTNRTTRSPEKRLAAFRFWIWPALAASATLVAVLAVGIILLRGRSRDEALSPRPEIDRCLETGQQALSSGKFMLAATELQRALTLRHAHPELLAPPESTRLTRLHRQAELLADLSAEPIETIIRHAAELMSLDPMEWKSAFGQRYQRRGVVFDTEVRRDAQGIYQMEYAVFFRGKRHTLDLGRVPVFDVVPWQMPQRLLFGIRLAEIVTGAEGVWTVRFDPESAVLLTDLGAACAICGQPEEELREVVRRQAEWTAKLP